MEHSSFQDVLAWFPLFLEAFRKAAEMSKGPVNDSNYDLLEALIPAITKTREFIETKGYQRSVEIQELWFKVAKLARKSSLYKNGDVPSWIFTKGEFWENPQSWLDTGAAKDLVPTLSALENEVENLKGFLGR